MFVLYIGFVEFVPHFIIYQLWACGFPAEHIGGNFRNLPCAGSFPFHFFFDVFRVENSRSGFYSDGFFQFLHTHVFAVSVICKIGIWVFSCDFFYGGVHSSHEFKYMVKAQSAPSVVLSGVDENICIFEGCF